MGSFIPGLEESYDHFVNVFFSCFLPFSDNPNIGVRMLSEASAVAGTPMEIICGVTTTDEDEITVSFHNHTVEGVQFRNKLQIANPRVESSGTYFCEGRTEAGRAVGSIVISVSAGK